MPAITSSVHLDFWCHHEGSAIYASASCHQLVRGVSPSGVKIERGFGHLLAGVAATACFAHHSGPC
jgi:hypothetical protein